MTLTIEFMRTRSPVFARVLSIARTIPTFKERESDGLTLYSVDFKEKDFESAQAFFDHVRGWKGVAFYIDGKVAPRLRAVRLVFDRCLGRAIHESRLTQQFGATPSDFIRKQRAQEPPEA